MNAETDNGCVKCGATLTESAFLCAKCSAAQREERTRKKEPPITKFGVIDESEFSLRSPRGIDGDECETVAQALEQAARMIADGAEKVSVVRARYSPRHEAWVEIPRSGCITVENNGLELAEDES